MPWLDLEEDIGELFGETGLDRDDLRFALSGRVQFSSAQSTKGRQPKKRPPYDPEYRAKRYQARREKALSGAKAYYQANKKAISLRSKMAYAKKRGKKGA